MKRQGKIMLNRAAGTINCNRTKKYTGYLPPKRYHLYLMFSALKFFLAQRKRDKEFSQRLKLAIRALPGSDCLPGNIRQFLTGKRRVSGFIQRLTADVVPPTVYLQYRQVHRASRLFHCCFLETQ